jgi:CheY-like chemotaxis protein
MSNLAGIRVLVVDDNIDSLDIFATVLRELGAVVRTARSAREALAIIATTHADVVVSDLAMPHEDGLWLLDQLRRLPHAQSGSVPAIAVTADRHHYDEKQAGDAGFDAFLTKPVDPFELAAVIAKLVGR